MANPTDKLLQRLGELVGLAGHKSGISVRSCFEPPDQSELRETFYSRLVEELCLHSVMYTLHKDAFFLLDHPDQIEQRNSPTLEKVYEILSLYHALSITQITIFPVYEYANEYPEHDNVINMKVAVAEKYRGHNMLNYWSDIKLPDGTIMIPHVFRDHTAGQSYAPILLHTEFVDSGTIPRSLSLRLLGSERGNENSYDALLQRILHFDSVTHYVTTNDNPFGIITIKDISPTYFHPFLNDQRLISEIHFAESIKKLAAKVLE